jgi:hypothetical protein
MVRIRLLDFLAALVGVLLVFGETVEPAQAKKGGDQPADQFPGQRRDAGTHFRERVERAKLLGKLPGLRSAARRLQGPDGRGALSTESTVAKSTPIEPLDQ